MAKAAVVKKNGKPVAASVSTSNGRGSGCQGKRQRAGLCPAQNAISQIASRGNK